MALAGACATIYKDNNKDDNDSGSDSNRSSNSGDNHNNNKKIITRCLFVWHLVQVACGLHPQLLR